MASPLADLAILTPVLGRPHRVKPLLESIEATTPEANVVFVCDPDDREEHEAIRDAGHGYRVCLGGYARKINDAIRATEEPLLFLGADDLEFKPGWFEAAKAYLQGKVGVVGTNDLSNPRVTRGDHATHFLVARWYVEQLGTVDGTGLLYEGYRHWYVDDELIATARRRGMYAHAPDSHVEHLHPFGGKAPMDDTYLLGMRHKRADRRAFQARTKLWT